MAIYQQSPGVQIVEKDASNVTVSLSSTIGAYVGQYRWGPVNNPMLISNEVQLASVFGQPDQNTYAHFFAAANFLSYTNAIWVNRAAVSGMANAVVDGTSDTLIQNYNQYENEFMNGTSNVGEFAARYAGAIGSGLKVSIADAGTYPFWEYKEQFSAAPSTSKSVLEAQGENDELHIVVVDGSGKFTGTPGTILEKFGFVSKASDAVSWEGLNNYYVNVLSNRSEYIYWLDHPRGASNWGNTSASTVFVSITDAEQITATGASWATGTATLAYTSTSTARYAVGEKIIVSGFTPAGYNGEFVVTACNATSVSYAVAATLAASTVQGTINSVSPAAYEFSYTMSGGKDSGKFTRALTAARASDVITVTHAEASDPIFTAGETIILTGFTPTTFNGTFVVTSSTTTSVTFNDVLSTNADESATAAQGFVDTTAVINVTDGELIQSWDMFSDVQTYDISLIVTGNASKTLAATIVQNIADVRRDCLAFTSITTTTAGPASPIFSSSTTKIADAKLFKTFDSTYAVIDSGYKYMYDKYNDKYRWIALNADTAGLCARVDATNDPWFSPAGQTKGQIKGVIKLAWNPSKTERDQLYPAAINPVINQVGQGTVLFGDRTATSKPSAFDKINVRRMFLILEKSIANSAKYQLFEINDEITRLQFVTSVEPFLRDVKGRRGIKEYKVICDETNNTPQVVSTNSFVGTILVIPNYSINYITLNFVAVGPNVTFSLAATV